MFRFKDFKILILLMLFAFAGQNAWAGNDFSTPHDSHLTVKVATGNGKVYAKDNNKGEESAPSLDNCHYTEYTASLTNTLNENNRPAKFYILAMPDEGYEFDYWECTKNEGDDDVDKADAVGTILTVDDSEQQTGNTWKVKAALSERPNATSNSNGDESSVINAVWEAHFKQITTQAVNVQSENNSLGTATINKGSNTINDEVMLTASCASTNVMFKGWYKINEDTGQKEFVNDINPYSFKITEDKKGTYYARFDDGYYFWRLKNNDTQHYVTSRAHYTGEVLPVNLRPALLTQLGLQNDLASSITDAGTMMDIYVKGVQASTYALIWDIYVQNEHTSSYYNEAPGSGVYLVVSHQADNTYLIQSSKFYVIESDGELGASMDLNIIRPYGKWQLEGMDKDLTTKKNYFAVAPGEFIGPDNDGYYWTTLRVCFNMKYDTNEITPFVVTAANATDGTMELTEVTGGIIPEKTCVLLRCNSTDVTRNVMIPTTQAAKFDAEAAGNLLESSEYYYKDQSVNANMNLKGIKLVDGYIGFGGDTKTIVDGNRAYLPIGGDVSVVAPVPNITLADLLESRDTENTYSVTDLTCVYARENVLYCKDDDGARNRSEMEDGEIDYLVTVAGLQTKPWDQSNWVAVKLPSQAGSSYLDRRLTKVVGRLTNTVNPEFEVTVAPSIGDENPYDENNYITCNFSGSHQANVTINNVEHNYYFVEPKPMEIANVKWALWNGKTFSKPSNASSDLMGEFAANFSFSGVPQSTGVYNFPALIKIAPTAQGIMPRAQDEATTSWLVFPLELTNQPVTAIDSLQSGKTAVKVVYYNLMGVESAVPHNGVNIVETRYSDGTRTTTKIIR